MLAKLHTYSLLGIEALPVEVEVDLSPAALPKTVSKQLDANRFGQYAAVGELSLEGHMRSVKGILSMAMAAAKQPGMKGMIVPAMNAQEAAVVESLEIIPFHTLQEAVGFLNGQLDIDPVPSRLDERNSLGTKRACSSSS